MGCGPPVVLVYRDRIWDMGYSYIGMGMGYRVWGMDCMSCWNIGMGYGIWTTSAASILGWGMGYGLWTACTASI